MLLEKLMLRLPTALLVERLPPGYVDMGLPRRCLLETSYGLSSLLECIERFRGSPPVCDYEETFRGDKY
jgi:hypothetical protein